MKTEPQEPEEREDITSALNAAVEAMNLAKEVSSITPAKAVFGSVSVILAMIRVSPPLSTGRLQTEMHLGRDGQPNRLCRALTGLRRSLCRPESGVEWEEVKRP